jgi:electron transport complex protein RnfG
MLKDMIKLCSFLTIACIISAAALSITYVATSGKIAAQKHDELISSMSRDCLPSSSSIKEEKGYYSGYNKNNKKVGYVFVVSPKGYSGAIEMAVGIELSGRVAGVKIISMSETPGLGLKAKEPSFLKQFIGKKDISKMKAKKDYDALTGATITSQAVGNGIKAALEMFKKIKSLFRISCFGFRI